MAQVLRYGLDRITDPDRVRGVCVAEVMEAGFRNTDCCDDLLQVLQDRIVDQMATFSVDKDEVALIFPCVSGSQLIFCLLGFDLLQDLHYRQRRLYDAGFAVLRGSEFIRTGLSSISDLLQLALDRDRSGDEVHTVPSDNHHHWGIWNR